MKENPLLEKSFAFAVLIVQSCYKIQEARKEYIMTRQLIRSGTSIGANLEEAQGGYSVADFNAKLSIAYKETRETIYWLKLMLATGFMSESENEHLNEKANELGKMLYSALKTQGKIR